MFIIVVNGTMFGEHKQNTFGEWAVNSPNGLTI